jgi:hypothetical protein
MILCTTYTAIAQISKQWESRYTETGYLNEAAQSVITDASGNSYVLGNTDGDALVIKYDANGKLVWSFQAGRGVFMEDGYEPARDLKMDPAGNLYLFMRGYQGQVYGASLLKLNNNGEQVWRTHMPGAHEVGKVSLAVHTDGSSFVFKRDDYWSLTLTKVTSLGEVSWAKTYAAPDESFVQEVSILNNSVVAWHYSGYQPYSRTSYLHRYTLDGNLIWENSYKYGTQGTYITGVQDHSNELIVSYYINNGGDGFNQITRYAMSNGAAIKSFRVQMDTFVQSNDPISVMYVGDDANVYVMGEENLKVKKFSLDGVQVWSYEFAIFNERRNEVLDFIVNKSASSVDVLIKTNNFNAPKTFAVVTFKPDKTTSILAKVSTSKSGTVPVALTVSATDIFVVGSFDNGIYKKDLLATKYTKSNNQVWDATFAPPNSQQHAPTCMTTDLQGNVYVGGRLGWEGDKDAFGIIKYSPTGEQLWSKIFAPDDKFGYDFYKTMVTAMASTPDGDIVVTGGIQLGRQFYYISQPVDMYTVKLNANGNIIWTAKTSVQTGDYMTGLQIGVDDNKNIYTLGCNYNLIDQKRHNMVLVKYDANGNQKWEKRFSDYCSYNDVATTGPDTNLPKMKILNNSVYIVSNGAATLDDYNYFKVMELRTFDTDGNETLLKQFRCFGCPTPDAYYSPRDLHIDASGNIFLLHGYSSYDFKAMLTKFSPAGQTMWSKTWDFADFSTFPTDGAVAFDASNNIYVAMTSPSEFIYTKLNANGEGIWSKKEDLKGYDSNFGHPTFVFVTSDDNPVFLSTNKDNQGSRYYFIAERNKSTGEIKHSETFDEVYDTYGWIPYWRPGDHLVSFLKSPNSNDFFISGVIEDKFRNSETIVTLKYSVAPVLPAPSSFTAKALSSSKIKLMLSAAPSNIERIIYSSIDGIQFDLLSKTKTLEVVHSGLNADRTYYYKIVDTDGIYYSVYSTIVEARTLKRPIIIGSDKIEIEEQKSFSISLSSLRVENAPGYPADYSLIVLNGDHYNFSGNVITSKPDFIGTMSISVRIASREDTSNVYNVPVIVYPITGVDETANWSVYPNPALDVIYISNESYEGNVIVRIFDSLGRSVHSTRFINNSTSFTHQVNLKEYSSGSCIVIIEDSEMRKSRFRIIKF